LTFKFSKQWLLNAKISVDRKENKLSFGRKRQHPLGPHHYFGIMWVVTFPTG